MVGHLKGTPKLPFRYAEQNNIGHNFNRYKGLAGNAWLYGFFRRIPGLKLKQPEKTSFYTIFSFNEEAVKEFHYNIHPLKFKFEPNGIFNSDETCATTVQYK